MMTPDPADSNHGGMARHGMEPAEGFSPGPYDIEVRLRVAPDQSDSVRQVRITYAEAGRRSEFLYDCTDAVFAADRDAFLRTAFGALLAEVKSRIVAGDEFEVWHKSEQERGLTQQHTDLLAQDDVNTARYVKAMSVRSRIIPLD